MTLTLLSRDDLMTLDLPEPSWIVDGLLRAGSLVVLSGREKSGKGLIAIDLCVSIATGEPFLDRATVEGPAVYLACEENAATVRDRVRQREDGHTNYPFHVVRLDGTTNDQFRLESPEDIGALLTLVELIRPVLVVIDPLRETHSGEENSSDQMAPRLRPLRQIAHQTGTTIILTHHANKGTGEPRGSTAIIGSVDDELVWKRVDGDTDDAMRGTLRASGRGVPKVVEHIAFDPASGRWVVTNAPAVELVPNLRERIINLLDSTDEWLDTKDIDDRLTGTPLKSVQNTMSRIARERPCPLLVSGQPTKGHPRTYHGIHKRTNPTVPDVSGNDAGNNGIASDNRSLPSHTLGKSLGGNDVEVEEP